MHGDAVKARPGREKTKMVVPPKVLTRPFRRWWFNSSHWLFSRCFHSPSPNTTERSQSINGTKVESGISDAKRRSLVRERRVKKDRMLVEKIQIEFVSKGSWTPDAVGEETKKKTGLLHRQPFERKSLSIKAKGRQSRSTGFARDFGLDRRGHKAKRSDARFVYIYIANGESPSQHVTVGLAEARPNYYYKKNCPLETAEPSRNYARVPGYKKKYKKKTRKRREKKEKWTA